MTKFTRLRINTDSIMQEIRAHEKENRREAAKLGANQMRKNINRKGSSTPGSYPARRKGILKRSVKYRLFKHNETAKVGSSDRKAHLLEYGHGDGKQKNKRPFVRRSLLEVENEMISIMSRRYF